MYWRAKRRVLPSVSSSFLPRRSLITPEWPGSTDINIDGRILAVVLLASIWCGTSYAPVIFIFIYIYIYRGRLNPIPISLTPLFFSSGAIGQHKTLLSLSLCSRNCVCLYAPYSLWYGPAVCRDINQSFSLSPSGEYIGPDEGSFSLLLLLL